MRELRIVVTGGRDFADRALVYRILDMLRPSRIAQGGATGADQWAREWARDHDVACVTYIADWKQYGKAAGPIRNEKMCREEKPDAVVAFSGGSGTANCCGNGRIVGAPVLEVT